MDLDTIASLLTDNSLSDSARVLGIYMHMQGDEPQEYKAEDLSSLLHGYPSAQTIWRHVRQLEVAKYIECVKAIPGQGHGKTLRALPVKNFRGNEKYPLKISGLSANTPENIPGYRCATTTPQITTTPPPPSTRVCAPETDLARLRLYLGEHGRVVDEMDQAAQHPSNWAYVVHGKYGPTGTQLAAYRGIGVERRPAVLATVLMEWTTTGKPYDNRHFDGFFRNAVSAEQRADEPARATGTDGKPRGAPGPARSAPGPDITRGQQFVAE